MAYNEGWVYLFEFVFIGTIRWAMKNKTTFALGIGTLLLVTTLSTSQTSIDTIKATPQEELIEKIPSEVGKKWLRYVKSKNEDNINNLELKAWEIENENKLK